MTEVIAQHTFTRSDQNRFAELSGDRNPMHMDDVAARRTQAGASVVHGIHAVLWALEAALAGGRLIRPVKSLKVQFQKFVYVGSSALLSVARETDHGVRLEVRSEELTAVVIDVGFDEPAQNDAANASAAPETPVGRDPHELQFSELGNCAGRLTALSSDDCAGAFPQLWAAIGPARTGAVVRLSTLVGMICPGLHSIFSGFTVDLVPVPRDSGGLAFHVAALDERFRIAQIAIEGGGIAGIVTAFVRHPPVAQPDLASLRARVGAQEFSGCVALIVGGSRGLGALTARAIAAGGGRVIVTYAVGKTDAEKLREEIGSACSVLRYDVRESAPQQLADLPQGVNQLYYFATSHIFRQKPPAFVPERFAEFCEIYVNGFAAACRAVREGSGNGLTAFYPSSIAVEEHPREMTEYSMAKIAAEMLCADLNRFVRGLNVIVKRLPRILTDQTATVMPVESKDPLEIMLPIIREMNEKHVAARTD